MMNNMTRTKERNARDRLTVMKRANSERQNAVESLNAFDDLLTAMLITAKRRARSMGKRKED